MNELIVTKNGNEIFRHEITQWNYTERISAQLSGGWVNVPLQKNTLYNVEIKFNEDDVTFDALYDGYWYSAMSQIDNIGVTNNSVQFNIIG